MVLAVVGAVGLVDLTDVEQFLVGAAGVVLLALTVDAGERRRLLNEHARLLHTMKMVARAVETREIAADEIRPQLEDLLESSWEWLFKGGSARFLRSGTLPSLATHVDRDVNVHIQVLDPRERQLCDEYGRYRFRQGRSRGSSGDEIRRIQADLLATVYSAAWYRANHRVRPTLLLLREFSPLRYDMGSRGVVVTISDLSQPGLYASSDSYYRSVKDELLQARHGNPFVDLPTRGDLFPTPIASVSPDLVREALEASEVVAPDGSRTPLLSGAVAPATLDFDLIARSVTHPDAR